MKLNTLNTLIDDIILQWRNSIVSESEHLSRIQVEQWIHNYRALLIKLDIDKGRDINPLYIQYIEGIHLDVNEDVPGHFEYEGDVELPKLIDFHYRTGLVSVTDMQGNLILIGHKTKMKYQKYRKYTCGDYIAYLRDNKIYVEGDSDQLEYINVGVIAENPADLKNCFDPDEPYPVPGNMVPVIKQMIFANEIRIMSQMISDTTNDTQDQTQIQNRNVG